MATVDVEGYYQDGANSYSVTLPKGIPAKDFWLLCVYYSQTRSMLQTPATFYPNLSRTADNPETNTDGSVIVYWSPEAPESKEKNWIQTVLVKGGSRSCASMGHLNPGSTRLGNEEKLSR